MRRQKIPQNRTLVLKTRRLATVFALACARFVSREAYSLKLFLIPTFLALSFGNAEIAGSGSENEN
jgi:hypothetical protein